MITLSYSKETIKKARTYPYVGKHPSDTVVLFTAPRTGIYLEAAYAKNVGMIGTAFYENEFEIMSEITIKSTI